MSYCPFQPPIVSKDYTIDDGVWRSNDDYKWQKCGEACALYSVHRQECVFSTIAEKLGSIAESITALGGEDVPW